MSKSLIPPQQPEFKGSTVHTTSKDPDAFGLRISGDSMGPRFKHGSTAIVEPHAPVKNGDVCAVKLKQVALPLIKQYFRSGKNVLLKSNNPECEPIAAKLEEVEYVYRVYEVL
jgi:SOS-response transcriptional repressor LexA